MKNNSEPSETLSFNGTACDIWKGAKHYGYACATYKGVYKTGHIFALEAKNGCKRDMTLDPKVRHLCNNRACVNPNHVELGSHGDNMFDSVINGRKNDKMNEHLVRYVKCIIHHSFITDYQISKYFDVSEQIIYRIRVEKNWKRIKYDMHPVAKLIVNNLISCNIETEC